MLKLMNKKIFTNLYQLFLARPTLYVGALVRFSDSSSFKNSTRPLLITSEIYKGRVTVSGDKNSTHPLIIKSEI